MVFKDRNFPSLFVISFSHSIIYYLPYIQNTYYDTMRADFGFTHIQIANLMCLYGIVNLISYLLGGMIADRFDSRLLMAFSLIATGLAGFVMATIPSYPIMLLLSVFWSITTVLTFWPTMIKSTRLLADSAHQGAVFSAKEIISCFISLGISLSGLLVFKISGENFPLLIRYYSGVTILGGVMAFTVLRSPSRTSKEESGSILSGMGVLFKNKGLWLAGITTFSAVAVGVSMGRFTAYTTMVYQLDVSTAVLVMIISTNLIANIGAFLGGRLCDRMKSAAKFIRLALVCMAASLALLILLPTTREYLWPAVAVITLARTINSALRTAYFVTLDEISIPPHLTGSAAGILSVIGYSPDAFLYTIWGAILGRFAPNIVLKLFFWPSSAFAFLVVLCLPFFPGIPSSLLPPRRRGRIFKTFSFKRASTW